MLDNTHARLPRHFDRFAFRTAAGLLALLACALGFLLLLVLARSAWTPLYRADQQIADGLNTWVAGNDLVQTVLRALTDFGGHTILMRVLLLATAYLLIRRQFTLAAYVVVTAVGALILDPTLKLLVGRLRPVVDMPVAFAPGMSFPSGHALGSIVSYGVLLLVFLPTVPRRWRTLTVGVTVALVVVVGFTRIALGVHHISDVVAGWLLGITWLAVTAAAFRRWHGDHGAYQAVGWAGGLAPEAAAKLKAAPAEPRVMGHPWRAAAELVVAWVMVFGLLYGAGLVITRLLPGTALLQADAAVVRWFAAHRDPALDVVVEWGNRIGNTHGILTALLAASVLIVALRRRLRPVVFLAVVMVGEVTLFLASSTIVGRDRPDVPTLGPEIPPTASFPSGHVAAPLCLYGALALLIWHWTTGWIRWIGVAAGVVVPVCVGLSRLYWGAHHPLDLAGSLLLAMCWVGACWWAVRPIAPPRTPTLQPSASAGAPADRTAHRHGFTA